jgi:hypothetical protein
MAQFEELQQIWQRQAQSAMPPHDAAALSDAFRRYGRRYNLVYLAKVIVLGCLLFFLLSLLRHRPLAAFGASLTVFSGILFLISDWRAQRTIARLNFGAPSVEFLRNAITRLEAQRRPFHTREFFIAMGGLWIGCNLIFAGFWHDMSLPLALTAVAYVSALPFAAYALGSRSRARRFEKQCRPLIDRLESVLQTMEADRL